MLTDRKPGGITAPKGNGVTAPFDIIHVKLSTDGNVAVFHMGVSDQAGTAKPTPSGKLAGARVFSYVWPTTIDSAEAGFDKAAGTWPSP